MCIDLSATVVVNEPDDYELDIVSGGIQLTIGSMSGGLFIFDKNDKNNSKL